MIAKSLSFYRFVAIFVKKKNIALLVQKLWGGKNCQNLFSVILRLKKKKNDGHSARGEGPGH